MQTRLVTFANSTVLLEYHGKQAAKVVDFLYSYIAAGNDTPPHLTYRLLSTDESGVLRLERADTLIYKGTSEAEVAEILLGDTCYHLADQSQDGLLFHAASLAKQDQGIILPGTMNVGKSTLTAWLLTRGFDYLTDELAFVPTNTTMVLTFTRPLNLKRTSRLVLNDYFDFATQAAHILSTAHTDLIPPILFRPTNMLSEPNLSLILFPQYQAGSDFVLQRLSKAQAGLKLMEHLINARNLTGHGFTEVTRLTRHIPAYEMSYSCFAQIDDQIEALLQRHS